MVKKKTSALLDTLQKHDTEAGKTIEASAPHGEKSDYIRSTITLPPDVFELAADEVKRRKIQKAEGRTLSAIIREALVAHLEK